MKSEYFKLVDEIASLPSDWHGAGIEYSERYSRLLSGIAGALEKFRTLLKQVPVVPLCCSHIYRKII